MQSSRDTFEAFNDGICSFHAVDEDGNAGDVKERLRFQERTVGTRRYYEAMTAKVQIDRLIRVPVRPWLTSEYLAVIEGTVYKIEQVQKISDTKPGTNDISLHLLRQRESCGGRDWK